MSVGYALSRQEIIGEIWVGRMVALGIEFRIVDSNARRSFVVPDALDYWALVYPVEYCWQRQDVFMNAWEAASPVVSALFKSREIRAAAHAYVVAAGPTYEELKQFLCEWEALP